MPSPSDVPATPPAVSVATPAAGAASRADPRGARWAAFDLLPVGVVVHDTGSEARFVNRAARELLGLSSAEDAERAWRDSAARAVRQDGTPFPAADHPAALALATQRPMSEVLMGFDRPDGERVWLLVRAEPVPAGDGSPAEVVSTLSDVSAQLGREAWLRESEARYRQLVEKAHDVIYRLDDKGRFTYVNPAASRVTGHAPRELIGRPAIGLVRSDQRRRVARAVVRQARARTATTYAEFVVVARDGRAVRVGQHMQLLFDGRRLHGFQAMARELEAPARAAARPPAALPEPKRARPLSVAPGGRRGKVLVVDDNEVSLHVTVALLDNLGYHADTATDGLQAVDAVARETYDAVLMDCQMPELDGFKATAFIREREEPDRRVPIIALSASVLPGERGKCLAAGMDDFLGKPVGLRQLEQVLGRWLGRAENDAAPGVLPDGHPLRGLELHGQSALVAELLGTFVATTPAYLREMHAAHRRADAARIVGLAHSLKGAAVQIGAGELAELCARLQAAARAADPAQIGSLLASLQSAFEDLRHTLEPLRRRLERAGES